MKQPRVFLLLGAYALALSLAAIAAVALGHAIALLAHAGTPR